MSDDTKPSNPKDAIGSKKLPLELVPDTIEAEVTLAFLEGALKYGRYNWRIAGVRTSIYYAAIKRHQKKWWNGEDTDPVTRVKHLASMMACCGILLDAELCGKLEDDRPPYAPIGGLMDSPEMLAHIAHLKELFKDHTPKQYVLADSPAPESFCLASMQASMVHREADLAARTAPADVQVTCTPRVVPEPIITPPAAYKWGFPVTPGFYKSRDGRTFTVTNIRDGGTPYRARGFDHCWTLAGSFWAEKRPNPLDLVERLPNAAE